MTVSVFVRAQPGKLFEAFLWTVGFAALGYCGCIGAQAWIAQRSANRELDRSLRLVESEIGSQTTAPLSAGALVGRIEVPRLGMSAAVFEGTEADILDRGVGHLHGSALPGATGNVVFAAHRDTFFRPLRNIRQQDLIDVSTPSGLSRYVVESTSIVEPTEMSIVRATPDAELTLITCYPFRFFGHAPKRFIVRARAAEPIDSARAGR